MWSKAIFLNYPPRKNQESSIGVSEGWPISEVFSPAYFELPPEVPEP